MTDSRISAWGEGEAATTSFWLAAASEELSAVEEDASVEEDWAAAEEEEASEPPQPATERVSSKAANNAVKRFMG